MDGAAHVASDQPQPAESLSPVPAPGLMPIDNLSEGQLSGFPPLPSAVEAAPFGDLDSLAPTADGEDLAGKDLAGQRPASEIDMNAFLGYEPDADHAQASATLAPDTMSQLDPNDPLGLSAYANSEMSAAKNGPLVVSIVISGIDAKDLRDEIRQAMQDSRFGWDTGQIMASIKGGVLRIDRVSPVKATILINRIKSLAVRIRWEQSAITEIDPTEKDF